MTEAWAGTRVGTRRLGLGAVCALVLTCLCVPVAAARQSSSDTTTTPKKPAAAKPAPTNTGATKTSTTTAKTTAHKHHKAATHTAASTGSHSSRKKKPTLAKGQQKIDSERAQAIQQALIREHYLTGEPSGTWNQSSEDAMRRYQADHGWQSKEVPDSRALIKLGLGPSNDHLLNPESAMTTAPDAPRGGASPAAVAPVPANPLPALPKAQPDSPSAGPDDSIVPR